MKIRPVILCGGDGTRLWPNQKTHQAKQFIDFGGWTLIQKTLERINNNKFDYPIISTNSKYLKKIRFYLKKNKVKKYSIVLEPSKKNTAPAILSSTLIKDIPNEQPLMFFSSDHLIEKTGKLIKSLIKNKGYWNSGMFFLRKDSIINNFKKYQPKTYKNCLNAVKKAKLNNNTYYLNKSSFNKSVEKSFDYAILEKAKNINAIKINIPWSDLGSWTEISKIYHRNKAKYFKKKNVHNRPWGKYVNLFEGKNFLVKELIINSCSSISLQKHNYRSEHWIITQGKPRITINNTKFFKKKNESIFIPTGAVHRIENYYKKPVKIIEVQIGSILKEADIVRYQDVYGRVK